MLNVVLAINDLVQLENYKSSHKCGSGGNGRDNLAGNELGLVAVGLLNLVVFGAKVAACRDEVDVMVRVIVLLKVNRLKLEPSQLAWLWKGFDKTVKLILIGGDVLVGVLK